MGGNHLKRDDVDLDTFLRVRDQRNEHWRRVRGANSEFMRLSPLPKPSTFVEWLNDTYGLKPILDDGGNITAKFSITDEKKYIMFLLKHT